ncbi:MAG: PQQ-binding-like beta-propeller repeat protein [Planctomycetia bacterium]|nr:PQQ-binding-like beta-propeller repeat protein [Planctomycetia bacterium]
MISHRSRSWLLASLLLGLTGTAWPCLAAEEALPAGALFRLGTQRLRHPYQATPAVYVAASADGKLLASRTDDGSVLLWEPASGRLLHQLRGSKAKLLSFAFTHDGNHLAAGDLMGSITLWDTGTGKLTRQWPGHRGEQVTSLAFAPDDSFLVSGGTDCCVRVWDRTGENLVRSFEELPERIMAVAVSPGGASIAAGGRGSTVIVWETATGKEIRRLPGNRVPLFGLAFHPDGKSLAVGNRAIVRLHDLETGKELRTFGRPVSGDVTSYNHDECLAFSPDGSLVATGGKELRLWETATGNAVRSLGDRRKVVSVAFAADGKTLYSGGGDQEIHLWDVASGKKLRDDGAGHRDKVQSVAFTPDGKLTATAGADRSICLWDAATGKQLRTLTGHTSGVTALYFAPDGKWLASSDFSGAVRVWEVENGKQLHHLQGPAGWVSGLAFSQDQKLLACASRYNDVFVWELAKEKELAKLERQAIHSLAFAPGSYLLALGREDGRIQLWDLEQVEDADEEAKPRMIAAHKEPVAAIAFSANGWQVLSWSEGGTICRSDVETAKVLQRYEGGYCAGSAGVFSADGKTLATAQPDRTLRLIETATGQERGRLPGHSPFIWSLAFDPTARRLVSSGEDCTALVWDVTRKLRDGRMPVVALTAAEMDKRWADLAGDDAGRAYEGLWAFTAGAEQALPFLKERLQPIKVEAKQLAQWIAQMDSTKFAERERAREALETVAEVAEEALKKALENKPSLEVQTRLERLLEKVEKERHTLNPHRLRVLRCIEILEQIGGEEARQLLASLHQPPIEMRLTGHVKLEAEAALYRLKHRP